jgi:hypothetical protein
MLYEATPVKNLGYVGTKYCGTPFSPGGHNPVVGQKKIFPLTEGVSVEFL